MILMLLPSAPAQEKASNSGTPPPKYLTPLKDPLLKPEAGASSELILSRDSGKQTDPILRVYGDYPSTTGSLGRLMGDRKAPGYKDPEGKVIALEVLKNGDVLFGPNTGVARRPADDKDPNSRLETDPQHTSPIDFYWDAQDRKLHVRSILLTENGDPADLGFRRSGDETYPYGPPLAIRAGVSLGAMYWMGWGAKGHGFNDRAAQIYARSAEDITDKAAGGKLHFATTPLGTTRPVDRLVISSEGQVGIGVTHPQASLHLADGNGSMAEDYPATEKLEAGDVVAIDENAKNPEHHQNDAGLRPEIGWRSCKQPDGEDQSAKRNNCGRSRCQLGRRISRGAWRPGNSESKCRERFDSAWRLSYFVLDAGGRNESNREGRSGRQSAGVLLT